MKLEPFHYCSSNYGTLQSRLLLGVVCIQMAEIQIISHPHRHNYVIHVCCVRQQKTLKFVENVCYTSVSLLFRMAECAFIV